LQSALKKAAAPAEKNCHFKTCPQFHAGNLRSKSPAQLFGRGTSGIGDEHIVARDISLGSGLYSAWRIRIMVVGFDHTETIPGALQTELMVVAIST
jgi:hypothetical protein